MGDRRGRRLIGLRCDGRDVFLTRPAAAHCSDTGSSMTGVSSAMRSVSPWRSRAMASGGLSDGFVPRDIVLIGAIILAASLALSGPSDIALRVQLIFGLSSAKRDDDDRADDRPVSAGCMDARRSLAVSLVSGRMGIAADDDDAPGRIARFNLELTRTTWSSSLRSPRSCMVAAALLVRRPRRSSAPAWRGKAGTRCRCPSAMRCASPRFVVLVLTSSLFRDTFRADLPHRELRADLRHSARRRRLDLQRRGACGHGRPDRLRPARRPVRRQARSGPRAAGAGVRRAGLCLRPGLGRVLCRRRDVRLHLCAASCRSTRFWRARIFRSG